MKANKSIGFYEKYNIVPSIDIQKSQFVEKRKKLYRQLGIPLLSIDSKDVIEFGAGSGENSLLLVTGFGNVKKGANHIDIVEPNSGGRRAIKELFEKNGVSDNRYTLYSDTLEDFIPRKKYDIIVAEQFLQHCTNWKECLSCLRNCARPNTIVIITCADTIGLYVELMKRFVGRCMVKKFETFDVKVQMLVELFADSLNTLKGANKTYETYIADMFFDDFILNGAQMNMIDAIDFLKNEFDVLGASQNIFTDYSWYKDLDFDYVSDYKKQYLQKRHMFLFAEETEETIRSADDNELLEQAIKKAMRYEAECEQNDSFGDIDEWSKITNRVTETARHRKMVDFNHEFVDILVKIKNENDIDLSNYSLFINSFGKTSQYLSLIQK